MSTNLKRKGPISQLPENMVIFSHLKMINQLARQIKTCPFVPVQTSGIRYPATCCHFMAALTNHIFVESDVDQDLSGFGQRRHRFIGYSLLHDDVEDDPKSCREQASWMYMGTNVCGSKLFRVIRHGPTDL
jgi:hypothetical protein